MRFERAGIAVGLPAGWDALLYRREELPAGPDGTLVRQGLDAPPDGGRDLAALERLAPGATTHPVLHTASFPLPPDRGDYGSGAVDLMDTADIFVSLLEFHPDAAKTPLFARQGVPRDLSSDDFRAGALQRTLPGQSGVQRFFSEQDRAFCLYVVLGSHARRHLLVPTVNALLESLEIAPEPS